LSETGGKRSRSSQAADAPTPATGEGDEASDEDAEASDDSEQADQREGEDDGKAERQARENIALLLQHFTPEQMDRQESFRRSALNKANFRRLINNILQQSVSEKVILVSRGFAKVFVGEIVERALAIQEAEGGTGPLEPNHIREAYRIYSRELECVSERKKPFVR